MHAERTIRIKSVIIGNCWLNAYVFIEIHLNHFLALNRNAIVQIAEKVFIFIN